MNLICLPTSSGIVAGAKRFFLRGGGGEDAIFWSSFFLKDILYNQMLLALQKAEIFFSSLLRFKTCVKCSWEVYFLFHFFKFLFTCILLVNNKTSIRAYLRSFCFSRPPLKSHSAGVTSSWGVEHLNSCFSTRSK